MGNVHTVGPDEALIISGQLSISEYLETESFVQAVAVALRPRK